MGILRELLHDFTFGLVSRNRDEQGAPYRCVKCGAGFDQNHQSCPKCGNQFVVPVGEAGESGEETGGQDGTAPWDR